MSRSSWKGPYINLNRFKKEKISFDNNLIHRNSEILPNLLGLTFKVHNGKIFTNVTVIDKMIGHKFGEFCFTRARYLFKKKK